MCLRWAGLKHITTCYENIFSKVGCVSHSLKIGDSNILEAKSFVGRSMNVSNGCIVGAGCR